MLVIEKLIEDIKKIDTSKHATDCQLYKMLRKENDCKHCCDSCDICLKNSLIELVKEYKEPIELTQFEYDLLDTFKKNGNYKDSFNSYICDSMKKERGYFKGVKDTSMTLKEILDNCVVKKDGN